MNKKVMGLLLAVTMLFAVIMPTSAATTKFVDLDGKDCADEVAILTTLGIVEGINEEQYAPDRGVNRAQVATILTRLMGAEETMSGTDIFVDVPGDHWAYQYVTAAYNAGLIVGMGDGTFAPDEYVTYAQLVKMLLCLMGYDVQAEAAGGYPGGYYAKAAQMGMLAGIDAEMDKAVSRGNMAIILYNTIDLPLFEQTSYGSGADGVYAESSDTLLSRYKDIFVVEGTVSANYFTALTTAERTCNANQVAIGTKVYNVGTTNAAEMLGTKVKAYYMGTRNTDVETPELLIIERAGAATEYTFTDKEISEETTARKLVYVKDGAEKTITIDDDATLIVNGQQVEEGVTATAVQPEIGTVTLVCNNGTSADKVIVWSYENGIVQSVDTKAKTVMLKTAEGTKTIAVDPEERTVKSQYVNADGTAFDIDSVRKQEILSVAESANDKVIRVIKNSTYVMGKVTEVDEDSVVVEGKAYTVADSCDMPALNTGAKFFLDFMGNIAAMDTNAVSDYMYGYLVNAAYSKGIEKKAQLKIFNQDGEMKVYETTDRVRVNDDYISNTELCENIPGVYKYVGTGTTYTKTDNSTIRQLIKYTINNEGKVNEMLTALNKTNVASEMKGEAGLNMVLDLNGNGQAYYPVGVEGTAGYFDMQKLVNSSDTGEVHWIYNLGLLGATMAVDAAKTVIFRIPNKDAADEDYYVITSAELPHRSKLAYLTAYDLTEGSALGAIVWDVGASGSTSSGLNAKYWSDMNVPAGLITSISKLMDNDDMESYYKIKLTDWEGNSTEVYARNDLKCAYGCANTNIEEDAVASENLTASGIDPTAYINVADLRVGDIVRFEKDASNFLTVAGVVYRHNTPGMKEFAVRTEGNIWVTTENSIYVTGDLVSSGTVSHVDANGVLVETQLVDAQGLPRKTALRTYPFKSSRVIIFDQETRTTKGVASANEIAEGDHIVVLWRTITPMAMFIYR
ncbi:MAG: S-layer homology domain-containing protein [Clostridia bacterium]|nr:S-layer homology domain-containing protein [Clostridia bacterium]